MSCVPLSPDHHQVLSLLVHTPPVSEHLTDALAELERWSRALSLPEERVTKRGFVPLHFRGGAYGVTGLDSSTGHVVLMVACRRIPSGYEGSGQARLVQFRAKLGTS